jgi:hypothetical protein
MQELTRHRNGKGCHRVGRWENQQSDRMTNLILPGYWRRHVGKGNQAQHGKPRAVVVHQPAAREGQAGPFGVAERLVVPTKPGNAGGGKEPQLEGNARSSAG